MPAMATPAIAPEDRTSALLAMTGKTVGLAVGDWFIMDGRVFEVALSRTVSRARLAWACMVDVKAPDVMAVLSVFVTLL